MSTATESPDQHQAPSKDPAQRNASIDGKNEDYTNCSQQTSAQSQRISTDQRNRMTPPRSPQHDDVRYNRDLHDKSSHIDDEYGRFNRERRDNSPDRARYSERSSPSQTYASRGNRGDSLQEMESRNRAGAFLSSLASDSSRQWGKGWVSNGPPPEGENREELLKDNLNETLVKNVFHGWNQETLGRLRRSLAERQARPFINVWSEDPPPPKPEAVNEPSKRGHGHGKDKKKRDKHKHKHKEKEKRKSKDKRHHKHRRYSSSSSNDSDSEDYRARRHHREDKYASSSKKRKRDELDDDKDESMMDESKREEYELMQEMLAKKKKALSESSASAAGAANGSTAVDEDAFGPAPIRDVGLGKGYGAAMLPGEADAYAQFVQDNKRIPRRGEIGLTAEAIENFEKLGFQMSGSRHRRMNAVRIRKESQIYSHEEQRILAQVNSAERAKRENQVVSDFRQILSSKLKEHAPSTQPPKTE